MKNNLSVDAEIDAVVVYTCIDGLDAVGHVGGYIVGSMMPNSSMV